MAAEAPVNLGTTANFAVLAGSSVTNTGPTIISGSAGGDVGVSPGTSITGFPSGTNSGTIHASDAVALKAQVRQQNIGQFQIVKLSADIWKGLAKS